MTADLAETRARLQEVEETDHEPIAITGMACRFPGDVSTLTGRPASAGAHSPH